MAITDIQFSEELQAGAPSIKYRGNEGPQSPQEEQQMAGQDYSSPQYRMQLIEKLMAQGLDFGAASNEADRLIKLMLDRQRQGSAYGGIAGLDGRRRYGIGSALKKRIRKLIPNEAARVAEVAAPFVAPFNPMLAAGMSGLGGFDRHGSISQGLKSGLMNYAGGQAARYLGGAELQGKPWEAGSFKSAFKMPGDTWFSKPIGNKTGIGKWLDDKKTARLASEVDYTGSDLYKSGTELAKKQIDTKTGTNLADKILKGMGMNTAAMAGIIGASALAGLYTAKNPGDDSIEQMRGSGMDIESIRTEVIEAFKDPSGEKLAAIRSKYPFLGAQETKNVGIMAEGGRAGYYAGGQSIPSEYTMEDARKTAMQDRLGGITEVMKQADLYRQGDVGQMYMNQGGRIGAQEGGIMDLGGMEKDYRNTGGFVDIGAKEKADDVPARLSVNEFVMTADAVRGAGGGDIDKGAEIMERVMKNLEEGGRISEESQGLTNRRQGASDMFEVSERLSAVV
jgi:hypothetical protein